MHELSRNIYYCDQCRHQTESTDNEIMGVKVIFVMSIVFGVILPNSDVGLDILLMINTLTFNIGNTLELSGCKICYKTNKEVYRKKKEDCATCLVNDYGKCGGIREFLRKFHTLQISDTKQCMDENWRITSSEQVGNLGNRFRSLETGKYNESANDICGIEYTKRPFYPNDESDIDRRLYVKTIDCPSINAEIEACPVYGQASYLFCSALTKGVENPLTTKGRKFKKELDRLLMNTARITGNHSGILNKLYKIKETKKKRKKPGKKGSDSYIMSITLEPDYHFEDGCGLYFRARQDVESDDLKDCDDDVCLIHLQTLHIRTNKIHDLESWYKNLDYYLGARVGGRVCSLLQIYGWTIMIPILMNFVANVIVFYNDFSSNSAQWPECIPLLLLVYPQWRVMKYLGNYLFVHRDENKLEKDKVAFERDVGTLEPYLEATIQVIYFFD